MMIPKGENYMNNLNTRQNNLKKEKYLLKQELKVQDVHMIRSKSLNDV